MTSVVATGMAVVAVASESPPWSLPASARPSSRKCPQGQSCDEYPFARTDQGALKSERRDWGWAWVPASEQHSQGGYLSAFYKAQRVLNGDKFWVEVP
ncbi:NucA/NucB deoxyribonuclease domain-containing protein [Streptomyces sp. NPDC096339]|uniref:NucA/NucB deoxyribonuclease domain-containing protein n=1 Tax=Streptomyces sp. NPDC096339 TaxID=3366086 RepID=UPI00383003C5